MPEMKASPRNSVLGMIADALAATKRQGNKAQLPILGGLGDLLIGKVPEEVNEWSYGNSPLQVVGGGTGSRIPQVKQGRAESLADTLLNGPGLAQLARSMPKATMKTLERGLMPPRAIAQAGAVKPRGGNWLNGEGLSYLDELVGANEQEHLGNWVRGPLTNYVKRDLGTANDPLLRLADEGISTLPKDQLLNPERWVRAQAAESRKLSGLDQPNLGGYAQGWSDLADGIISPQEVGGIRTGYGKYWGGTPTPPDSSYWKDIVGREGEWLGKLPDEAKVYGFHGDEAPYSLGFNNVVEALRTGIDPTSTLPPGLRLKPEDLQQMGMEKAVRYQDSVEKFKAVEAERAAARLAEQMGKQGTLVKEFPSGHRIVELNKPEKLDEQMMATVRQNSDGTFSPIDSDGNVVQKREVLGGNLTDVVENTAEDAYLGGMLANEGNAMQHCVGGYCSDVSGGRTKIYSIRDAKGEPHVTIETTPPPVDIHGGADDEIHDKLWQQALDKFGPESDGTPEFLNFVEEGLVDAKKSEPWIINQVYGKQNTRPKDEYMPAIQDFVRSSDYDVTDDALDYTGLSRITDFETRMRALANTQYPNQRYLTPEEVQPLANRYFEEQAANAKRAPDIVVNGEPPQYKDGGLVEIDDDFGMPGHF